MLEVRDLQVYYGAIHAVKGISFSIKAREIVSLIGSNGAGKTTTLKAISGLLPYTGEVSLSGQSLFGCKPHEIVKMGISQSPEGRGIFPNLTVKENLEMGAYSRTNSVQILEDLNQNYEMFPRLKERQNQLSGTLSGGEQQMLSISRALMSRPKLLILDEPSLGLAPRIVMQIFDTLQELNRKGLTILLVEQNARMALKVSHRAYVIETGAITLQGVGTELAQNDEVRKSYLGGM